MGVIFDLDQTIVDSNSALPLRTNRNWQAVYNKIPQFTIYKGIVESFRFLEENKIKIVIVTSSPKVYCEKVISHFKLKVEGIIGFHDTQRRKPNPDPIIKAVHLLRESPSSILSFGDHPNDIIASRDANVYAIACLWGCADKVALRDCNPDFLIETPERIIDVCKARIMK